jgi:hypothetical protein
MSRQTERRKQAEKAERQRRKAKREARKAARVPLLAAESHRGWLSGRFLTSWLDKKVRVATKLTPAQIVEAQAGSSSLRNPQVVRPRGRLSVLFVSAI